MSILLNTAISALDTPSSLLPFFIKDTFDVTGRTAMAYNEGGKHEAREKFIEEAGTSLFWIGGIPFARWVANKLYKNKIDSEIHFKRINQDGIQNYFAEKLTQSGKNKFSTQELEGIELGGEKLTEIKEKLKKAEYIPNKTKGFYKKFHVRATAAAVLINLAILSLVIPQLNFYLSRKLISKEVNNKKEGINKTPYDTLLFGQKEPKTIHKPFIKKENPNKNNPSFGSLKDLFKFKELFNFASIAETAQLAPVNGMLLLDYGISGSRVTFTPRNNNERMENIIKEGGIIFFFYYAAGVIKNGLCRLSNKLFNVPIDLDYKILNNADFLNALKNVHEKETILKFVPLKGKQEEDEISVIKLIDQELAQTTKETSKENVFKNFTLKMAEKEGLIDIEFDNSLGKWIRHSKKYIETEKVIALNNNLRVFYEKAFAKINKADITKTAEKIISKTKKVKMASIIANLAICSASLCYIIPKIQYLIREHRTQTKSAPGIKHYQELAKNNQLGT